MPLERKVVEDRFNKAFDLSYKLLTGGQTPERRPTFHSDIHDFLNAWYRSMLENAKTEYVEREQGEKSGSMWKYRDDKNQLRRFEFRHKYKIKPTKEEAIWGGQMILPKDFSDIYRAKSIGSGHAFVPLINSNSPLSGALVEGFNSAQFMTSSYDKKRMIKKEDQIHFMLGTYPSTPGFYKRMKDFKVAIHDDHRVDMNLALGQVAEISLANHKLDFEIPSGNKMRMTQVVQELMTKHLGEDWDAHLAASIYLRQIEMPRDVYHLEEMLKEFGRKEREGQSIFDTVSEKLGFKSPQEMKDIIIELRALLEEGNKDKVRALQEYNEEIDRVSEVID